MKTILESHRIFGQAAPLAHGGVTCLLGYPGKDVSLAACAHHCLINCDKMEQSKVHPPHLGTIVHLLAALFAQGPLFGKQILMFPCSQALYCAIKKLFSINLPIESGELSGFHDSLASS